MTFVCRWFGDTWMDGLLSKDSEISISFYSIAPLYESSKSLPETLFRLSISFVQMHTLDGVNWRPVNFNYQYFPKVPRQHNKHLELHAHTCIHTNICTDTDTYMDRCLHTPIYLYMHACIHYIRTCYVHLEWYPCIHTHMHANITYIHTYIHACMHTHTHIKSHGYACTHARTHTYICTHNTHTYIYTCTHTYKHPYIHA
jgi:hypothetical protein